jgi:hypothetical protein
MTLRKQGLMHYYPKVWELITNVVRHHQPQDDIDTIKRMRAKYDDNGGRIHDDNCFYFIRPTIETDSEGTENVNLIMKFMLT